MSVFIEKIWKQAGLVFLLCLILLMGCSKTEELRDEDVLDKNDKIEVSVDDTEETIEENAEDDVEVKEEDKPEASVWDETKAVTMATSANVNFRAEPNTDCEILQVITKWTEVKAYEALEGWAIVQYDGKTGYISSDYLVDPAEIPEEPEEPENEEVTTAPSSPKVEAIPGQHRNPNSAVVVIDPGHQGSGDSTKEPNGPGSSVMKARVTSGTSGVSTGVAEYVLNLDISLKLRTELENRGYTVYMTRSTHDINISNMERAQYATTVGADIAVRIHANGSTNSSVRGAEALAPSKSNPYVGHLAAASQSLSACVLNAYCSATGFSNRGVMANDTMTGINWSDVPVTILELGFMSNAQEDQAMQDAIMQNNMVQGIANGIDAYFGF